MRHNDEPLSQYYRSDEPPDRDEFDDDTPIGVCPECHEPIYHKDALDDTHKICDACIDNKVYAEIQTIRQNRQGRTITGWVAACNSVLREYKIEQRMEYCSQCQIPTYHEDLHVQSPDAYPGETEYMCMKCEMEGRNPQ